MNLCSELKVILYFPIFLIISLFVSLTAFGQSELYFAQAVRGNSLNTTEIFVQNSDSSNTDVTVRFFNSDGTLEETRDISLEPNGGGKLRLGNDELDSFSVGYAVVSSTGNVVATAFYFLQAGGESLPPIGILPETGSSNWRTFAKIESGVVNTGIAVAVPGSGSPVPSYCQLNLYSGADGQLVGSGEIDFDGNEQLARFITQLIPSSRDGFEGPVVLSCDQPVIAAALTQESSGALSTVAMEPSSGATDLYFAQAVRGNSLNTTEIYVQNSDSVETDVMVQFFRSDGTLEETREIVLEPNGGGKIRLGNEELDSFSVGYAVVSSTGNVVATAFYFLQAGGESLAPIGILPETGASNWRTFAKIESGVVNTGIAVAVPGSGSPAPSNCQLNLYSGANGTLVGSGEVDFGGNEQLARFITQLIPSSRDGFEGPVILSCDQPVVAAALTQESSGALSTVAMVPSSDDGGGGEPSTGTALLPKRVTGLSLTSDRTLNQTLPAGVQITGIIASNLPAFGTIVDHQTVPAILSSVSAVCDGELYQGAADFQGSYVIPVPKLSTCSVYALSVQASGLAFISGDIRAQGEQGSTVFIQQKLDPPVEVRDSDVTRNFDLPTPSFEIVQGGVSNLGSIPAELMESDPLLVFRSTEGDITGVVTLPGEGSARDYHLELPTGHSYIVSLELLKGDEEQDATGELTNLYDIGRVDVESSSLIDNPGPASLTVDFSVPATAQLSGVLSELDAPALVEGSLVIARDTRAPGFSEFFGGIGTLGDGLSAVLPPASGSYQLTLAVGQQYSLLAGVALDENRFWGVPADLDSDVISFNGTATRDFSFPSRPVEVTLAGQVISPALSNTSGSSAASGVSVAVSCRNLSGASDTFFTGSTETDSSGNYSIQVLSGSVCEVEFSPPLPDLGFPFPFVRK